MRHFFFRQWLFSVAFLSCGMPLAPIETLLVLRSSCAETLYARLLCAVCRAVLIGAVTPRAETKELPAFFPLAPLRA